nr:hypothetical protein CFP56_25847 [Quercus suber]
MCSYQHGRQDRCSECEALQEIGQWSDMVASQEMDQSSTTPSIDTKQADREKLETWFREYRTVRRGGLERSSDTRPAGSDPTGRPLDSLEEQQRIRQAVINGTSMLLGVSDRTTPADTTTDRADAGFRYPLQLDLSPIAEQQVPRNSTIVDRQNCPRSQRSEKMSPYDTMWYNAEGQRRRVVTRAHDEATYTKVNVSNKKKLVHRPKQLCKEPDTIHMKEQ